MARVLVVGAGMCGLSTGMLLARDGHDVTILERDPGEPPPAGRAWDTWQRPGVNQFRLPHLMPARWRVHAAAARPYRPNDRKWAVSLATFAASRTDPDIARAYQSLASLLATSDELLAEPGLAEKITKLGGHAPNYPSQGRPEGHCSPPSVPDHRHTMLTDATPEP